MTSRSEQIASCGIAVEADGELILVDVERTFQALTIAEIERFHERLKLEYRRACFARRAAEVKAAATSAA